MIIPIEKLRVRVGLQPDDTSKDAELTEAWTVAWAITESYLNRKLEYVADWIETFTHVAGYAISLERYPVCAVASIVSDVSGSVIDYHLEKKTGIIHVDGRIREHEVTVSYGGGYVEDTPGEPCPYIFPPDLMTAIQLIFDGIWEDTQSSSGGLSPEGIQSITINDVGTIRWGSVSSVGEAQAVGFIPASSVAILSTYKRELC